MPHKSDESKAFDSDSSLSEIKGSPTANEGMMSPVKKKKEKKKVKI